MNSKPTYKNVHNRFLLNGNHYRFTDLFEVAYSFLKEGDPHEEAIGDFLMDWIRPNEYITLKTSGSTGTPKNIRYHKQSMVNSALATGDHFGVKIGDKALHCLNADFIAGKMMLVRAMILGLEIDLVPPQGDVLSYSTTRYDFAAMVPLQVENSFTSLSRVKTLLIGGSPSSKQLKDRLKSTQTDCYETYGMTETLTHIASRKINGKHDYFTPLPGVCLSKDERQCLVISVPYLTDEHIVTNDVVDIDEQHNFYLKGRIDNVINTGGIKVVPEEIEAKLSAIIDQPFFIGSKKDDQLGLKVILVIEGSFHSNQVLKRIDELGLNTYTIPKEVHYIQHFTRTPNGKIMRKETLKRLDL